MTELYSLTVINQMQIHGILRPEWVMGCYGIRNLTVSFDGFIMQGSACCFNEQRNRTVDHRNQSWNHNVLTAHSDRCMEFDIFLRVILMSF